MRDALTARRPFSVKNKTKDLVYAVTHNVSPRQIDILLHGGMIHQFKEKFSNRQDLSADRSVSCQQDAFA